MKTNKKGFTLVELVIVIAVIAILAGVMIAIFSNVIKKANESAELQQVKNDELAQKADDVLKKVDNANWFSWEDFENSLAAKMTEVYKANASSGLSAEELQTKVAVAVKEALEEYGKNHTNENTSLTETQVKAIVENALAQAKLGGVTENQVRTIVNTAVAGIETVNKTDVQKIVDAAVAKGLTAADVAKIVADAGLATAANAEQVKTAVNEVLSKLEALEKSSLKKEDVEAIIKAYLPVTVTVAYDDVESGELDDVVKGLVSGSTVVLDSSWEGKDVSLTLEAETYVDIRGNVTVGMFIIDAPAATVNVYVNGNILEVEAIAMASLHVYGQWSTGNVASGRLVIESEGEITALNVTPASETASVKVLVKENGTVGTANVAASTGTSVEIKNEGTVAAVVVDGTTTPVSIEGVDAAKVTGSENANVTVEDNNAKTWAEYLTDETKAGTYKLTEDVTLDSNFTFTGNVVIDLDGHNIVAKKYLYIDGNVTIKGNGVVSGGKYLIEIYPGKVFTLEDATVSTTDSYSVWADKGSGDGKGGTFIMNSGKVVCNGAYAVVAWGDATGGNTTFVMNGGSIEAESTAIGGSGNDQIYGSTWTINGGAVVSKTGGTVYHPNLGTFTINGGSMTTEMTGKLGIEMKAGTLVINGGTFKTTGESDAGAYIYSNGGSGIPAVVALVKNPDYAGKINVTINGGTFSTPYKYVVGIFDMGENDVLDGSGKKLGKEPVLGTIDGALNKKGDLIIETFVIKGGTFSNDVTTYIAQGCTFNSTDRKSVV